MADLPQDTPPAADRLADLGKKRNSEKSRKAIPEYVIVSVIIILASVLLLSNLGNQYLWQDEAETAVVARTVLTHGIPMATDGRNSFSQFFGDDMTKSGVSRYHPWFSYYLLAAFFAVFGVSTFVARLPFALFGVATIVLIYFSAKSFLGTRRAGIIAATCLMLSVPFLLLARQCRYYSPEMFFSLLGVYAYYRLLSNEKRCAVLLFVAAMLLFHCHFIMCAALLATLVTHALIWRRDKLKTVAIVCAAVVVVNAPWMIYFSATTKAFAAHGDPRLPFVSVGLHLFQQIFKHAFHPSILALLLIPLLVHFRRERHCPKPDVRAIEKVSLLVLFVLVNVITADLTPTYPWFRVICASVPICILLTTMILETASRVHVAIAVAAIAALVYLSPMSDYVYEIRHDYDGPVGGIVKFLNAHAKPTDTVVITYDDLPLKFYTKLRVLGGLTGEDLAPAKTADWIILRQFPMGTKAVQAYLLKNVPRDQYESTVINYPDLPTENREEPDAHCYRTVVATQGVCIAERIKK